MLAVPIYAAYGLAECLWHFTARHAIEGNVGKWTDDEIAGQIGWDVADAGRLIEALVACRLLDRHSKHRLVVHDWHEHCDESVTKTVRNRKLTFASIPEKMPTEPAPEPDDSGTFEKSSEESGNVRPKPSLALPEPKPISSSKLRSDPKDHAFAEFMLDRIRKVKPNFKSPNLDSWANSIRLAREVDGRTLEELRGVFLFANSDAFWQSNVLSADTLREKFDQLQLKSQGPTNGHHRNESPARQRGGDVEPLRIIRAGSAPNRTGESATAAQAPA